MKHTLCISLFFFAAVAAFSFTFTDDLGRTVTVVSPRHVAVLEGSLAAVWQLSGGTVESATGDAFTEPAALSAADAVRLNDVWHTDAFRKHDPGVLTNSASVRNVGSMMSPNSELIVGADTDFIIMSANISGHKKLLPLFERAGIPCAFFKYETFTDYLSLLHTFSQITGNSTAYEIHGTRVQTAVTSVIDQSRLNRKNKKPAILLIRAYGGGAGVKNSTNNMTGALLADLGTVNIADSDFALNENLSIEKVIADDPEYIFITTMGTDEQKAVQGLNSQLASNPAWNALSAVKNNHCYILPRELFHLKPGDRWYDCYHIVSYLLDSKE